MALNDALRAAGLFALQYELGEARIGLDSNIASAGGNLSVGEKQILALARAMVRGSKLLILDEGASCFNLLAHMQYVANTSPSSHIGSRYELGLSSPMT